ncbi:protein virilizer homolog isoform X2 [Phoenix dactylifera]|uniref:Protein virilizer homolog isoform X2 n=1 Tax=Phoenix dactylifera TaxID=42345 RepID=A0A8B9AFH5_PHODC|nr:protein virilizer homolog isoform X2 [Phoenix dactylifera]
MGRPEPCVLFAQSFVHSQLDEYVDEVLFAEPVVITACEFLEQNASPSTPNLSLIGATSPPSFALEVFVHCEGESRFRRLCQPFLYSHSSSNVLEVEAIVTNHLVLRGSYRCLTLVVYGNTAEDLGQFNIEFDLDTSLANVVCSPSEAKLEDLPPALHSAKMTFKESISSLKSLNFLFPEFDIPPEMKQFLLLALKICQVSDHENTISKLASSVVSAVCSYATGSNNSFPVYWDQQLLNGFTDKRKDSQQFINVLSEARKELVELYEIHSVRRGTQLMEDGITLGSVAELPTSKLLVDMFNQCFPFFRKFSVDELPLLSQIKNMILAWSIVLVLCSSRESCFHFVDNGGMEQIVDLFCYEAQNSTAITLILLGIVEHATRHGIGCDGFLGWWPRGDENVPVGKSEGYCYLLKLLLGWQRHDVASRVTYILHRLHFYETVSKFEAAVLCVLANLSSDFHISTDGSESLAAANSKLKQILKLINMFGPIEDSSPLAFAQRLSISGQSEGLLSYKATVNYITTCKYSFARWDIDTYLLSLLKERGFFPLSAALLSSPVLRSASGSTADIFMEIATSIESILLSLLFYRSGLSFLLVQPEATELIILSLRDPEDTSKKECMALRQAAVFLSKGFFCHPQEVGMIIELHLKVGTAIDRLLATTTHSDELLWVLWELCGISRSHSGRQALLTLSHFPEAILVLLDALRSFKEIEPSAMNSGTPPLSLAIFHSAAEIFEVMVTDSTASSLKSWIGHAVELHKALHSSSPGSNKKDAPTRLLEWIDAGVVYHRNGAVGLLRYAAVLASGGDAQPTIDVENVVGDSTNTSDSQVVDNLLGKFVTDKYFDGVTLCSTSIVQLTTAFRILAFISEDAAVAASLFEEGAVNLVYVVLVNCKFMLERLSNNYDYLLDEGAECNTTTDLLLERSHEQSLVDLMIPSLVLLINLLRMLHETKEQYRNKKLLNALLQLHREVSPKLAACAVDLSFPYASSALGFGAVCQLLTSALACWPIFGWTPGLFHCLLESVQATSSLALGPKDACSMLCLLGDLFPEEGIWLWKYEIPPLSALGLLSIGSILGPQAERDIIWYLQPEHLEVLLVRLTPQLDRIAQVVLHFASTALVVVQDMLRVLIIRVACQRTECAVVLLRPIFSWMDNHVNETSLSDMDIFKMLRLLHFVANLLEHPHAKVLLFKTGAVRILGKVLKRCSSVFNSDGKLILESRVPSKSVTFLCWCLPVLKSLALICNSQSSINRTRVPDQYLNENIAIEENSVIVQHVLKLCQVLPVGRELLACLVTFKELTSCSQGRSALSSLFSQLRSFTLEQTERDERYCDGTISNEYEWRSPPPFLNCFKKLLRSLESKDCTLTCVVEIAYGLSLSALSLSRDSDALEGILILKCLFGLLNDMDGAAISSDKKSNDVLDLIQKLEQSISEDENLTTTIGETGLHQVKESLDSLLFLLQSPAGSSSMSEGIVLSEDSEDALSLSNVWKLNEDEKAGNQYLLEGFAEKFVWECPDSSLDRRLVPALSARRKLASVEGPGRRARDNTGSEAIGSNVLSRVLVVTNVASGPTRRDTFRQRKPNTSRPPSMHVDDYVARERNIDGASSGSNIVSSSQRGTSTSGRPPSIHVDEFMARQRERQNPMAVAVGDGSQIKNSALGNDNVPVKLDKPQHLKTNLDDDQEIDIVFDDETESDERLPFPQPDNNLQTPLIIGESSPGSIVEETEGDVNENSRFSQIGTPPASEDGGSHSDIPLRRSIFQSEISVAQQISSEKNMRLTAADKTSFREQSEESEYVSPIAGSKGFDAHSSANLTSFPSHFVGVCSVSSSVQPLLPSTLYHRNSPQKTADGCLTGGSQGYGEQKLPNSQLPLPPMPPSAISSVLSQTAEPVQSHSSPYMNIVRDVQPPLPSGYPLQAFDVNGPNTVRALNLQSENYLSTGNCSSIAQPVLEPKLSWNSVSGSRLHMETFTSSTSAHPTPPLPPLPPPFSTPITHCPTTISGSQASLYNQGSVAAHLTPPLTPINDTSLGIFSTPGTSIASYSPPAFTPTLLMSRPASVPGTLFSPPTLQHGQNSSILSQPVPSSQTSVQSMHPRPPPPPPPQLPRPPQPQHTGPPIQIPQQLHIPQLQFYYETQQQESLLQPLQPMLEQAQLQNPNLQVDSAPQQQEESVMTLQQYFSSPEAIQTLLSDRDKLCQLLEQHPKLMQMLQERLGQQ